MKLILLTMVVCVIMILADSTFFCECHDQKLENENPTTQPNRLKLKTKQKDFSERRNSQTLPR